MGRTAAGALLAVVLIAVVVTTDLLFFRHQVLARFAANVGIVLVFVVIYLRLLRRP